MIYSRPESVLEHHRFLDKFPFLSDVPPVQAMLYLWRGASLYTSQSRVVPADMSQVFVEGLLQTRIIEAQERLTEINQVRRTTFDQFAEAFVDYEKCKGVQDFVVNGSMGSQRFKMERSEKHGFIELYGQIASNFAKVVFRPLARIYYGEEKRLSIRVSQELRVEFKMARKNPIVTCVAWERELEINATPYDLLMGALIASGNFDD